MAPSQAQTDAATTDADRVSVWARPWADWVGFTAFACFALWLITGPRSLGVFLVVPVLYELGTAATFLLRGRARHSIRDVLPRIAAYVSSFLIPAFMRLAQRWDPAMVASSPSTLLQAVGASMWLTGALLAFWPLWYLRGSFSVEPVARQLVTNGPYRIARHPIYVCYVLVFGGLLLLHFTVPMLIVTVVWFGATLVRIRFEERVLTDTFPGYVAYRQRVGRFGPRFWHGEKSGASNRHRLA